VELPLNGRLATDLNQLTGAVITQGVAGAGGFPNTANLVVAGGRRPAMRTCEALMSNSKRRFEVGGESFGSAFTGAFLNAADARHS
jgi:hypothetical protein